MALLGRVLLALQLHRGGLPHLHHRGAGQHTAELSGRDDPACAASAGGSDHGAARQARLALERRAARLETGASRAPRLFGRDRRDGGFLQHRPEEFLRGGRRERPRRKRRLRVLRGELPQRAQLRPSLRHLAARRGGGEGPSGDGFERKVSSGRPERRLNVVLISVESLGAEFLGVYGNRHGLTPYLDKLSRESLWFSRVYSSGIAPCAAWRR